MTFAAAAPNGNASPPTTFASSATVLASAPLSTTRPLCSPSGVTSSRTGAPVRLGPVAGDGTLTMTVTASSGKLSSSAGTGTASGVTTSGCVRATVGDSLQHGYRTIVPKECSGDRAPGPHEANLFDMNQKYADVLPNDEVVAYLESLPAQSPAI